MADEQQHGPMDADWPPELDAMVAAPAHHHLLLENDRVRVLDSRVRPGETVAVHTHRWPASLYVMGWSDFIRRDPDGNVLLDSRTAGPPPKIGTAIWSAPLPPHSLENIGDGDLWVITVEIKG